MACSKKDDVLCDPRVEDTDDDSVCGTVFAFPYFISFYVLCSFLVSSLGGAQHAKLANCVGLT